MATWLTIARPEYKFAKDPANISGTYNAVNVGICAL